jgi:hypothetical protein
MKLTDRILLAASAALLGGACAAGPEPDRAETPALSAEQRASIHAQMFAELDTDHGGTLSPAELEAASDHGRLLLAHLPEIDTDGDGALSQDEIGAAMGHDGGERILSDAEAHEMHEHQGKERFDAADTDKDGTLSADELEAAPAPGPFLAEHLDEIDADGDGALSHEEIAAAMTAHHGHHD